MADEPRSATTHGIAESASYEPPQVEDLPAEDGSAVTAEGVVKSPPTPGAEWRM